MSSVSTGEEQQAHQHEPLKCDSLVIAGHLQVNMAAGQTVLPAGETHKDAQQDNGGDDIEVTRGIPEMG